MEMQREPTPEQLKRNKVVTGLVLAAIAVAFFVGMILRHLTK
ncbi:MAG TPA: hypothetical protein VHA15_15210 [Burkholderiales bacterium]|nr:hypothetical protein [Burkholderiales bacterium]